ncbi:4-hydroxy-tetrahydrodipicolinate synthase [Caldinitratiruptor microaerophilus]|uniref:4-hydroxy-tetrahydrodipicolinate synthase n=1 Tax=Caldinitratiruptor microaerophilus TaxID=671077 RepID=A0AA35CKX8_9FIRM|nr:4-hydroxy-tetrahydrodipicolinate synthase [Caldinitratiruptor microaerophilus]BDG59427.1 4-hydroxy-tetrahydrodipicolinate synthase [Caldinitratiruptor microaerophilus]
MPPFGRLVTAMVTPMQADGSVDYERAALLARRLADEGSDAIVVAGTTGESPTLSRDEKLRLFETVARAVGARVKVLAGTGSYNTAESVQLSRQAEGTGVHGLLLVTPYYNKPPQEGLFRHFGAIAEATRLPIMLYNVPSRTSVNLLPATVARLVRAFPNIVALKECVPEQAGAVLREAPEGFAVYSGDDAATLPIMAQGGVGVVSVASHVVGPRMREMIDAYVAGDVARAARIHQELLPVFKALFATTNPILVKAALEMVGFPVGGLRLPLVEATEKERELLREALAGAGVLVSGS